MSRLIDLTSQTTRRQFAIGATGDGAALVRPRMEVMAMRQGDDLSSAGLPTLDITISNDGYTGIPETTEAGRYLVNVSIMENVDFGGFGGVAFLQPPAGMDANEFLAVFGIGQQPASPETAASPAGQEGEDGGAPPTVVYQATYAGGTVIGPDGTPGSVVLDLGEGEWIAWADEPSAPQAPVIFTVTGAFPDEVAEPESDISVTMIDFGITVVGTLTAGDHILKIENQGAQPHFLLVDQYVGSGIFDNELFAAVLEAEMTGAEMPQGFDLDTDLRNLAVSLTQSIGTTTWIEASLEAGTYLMSCFFPSAGTGIPHAMVGMHQVLTVRA